MCLHLFLSSTYPMSPDCLQNEWQLLLSANGPVWWGGSEKNRLSAKTEYGHRINNKLLINYYNWLSALSCSQYVCPFAAVVDYNFKVIISSLSFIFITHRNWQNSDRYQVLSVFLTYFSRISDFLFLWGHT